MWALGREALMGGGYLWKTLCSSQANELSLQAIAENDGIAMQCPKGGYALGG
jgi:hypothetical protein